MVRGHLVPAEDMAWSAVTMEETFLLSNVVPQLPNVNNSKWRQLENTARKFAATADSVLVISGVLFETDQIQTLEPSGIAVPTHFFKVILVEEAARKTILSAIVPNAPTLAGPLDSYLKTQEEVERAAPASASSFH